MNYTTKTPEYIICKYSYWKICSNLEYKKTLHLSCSTPSTGWVIKISRLPPSTPIPNTPHIHSDCLGQKLGVGEGEDKIGVKEDIGDRGRNRLKTASKSASFLSSPIRIQISVKYLRSKKHFKRKLGVISKKGCLAGVMRRIFFRKRDFSFITRKRGRIILNLEGRWGSAYSHLPGVLQF